MLDEGEPLVLRSLPIDASLEEVQRHLADHEFSVHPGQNDQNSHFRLVPNDRNLFCYQNSASADPFAARFMLQPFSSTKTIIHGLVAPAPEEEDRLASLLHYNTQLTRFREKVESGISVSADQWLEDIDRPTHGRRGVALST
ncbi:uncharacterized protein METZ01_LOCUS188929, partial [marine metagenome]